MELPVNPPVAPMLAKPVDAIPDGDYVFEPKWDGFRSIVFRDGDEVEIGSRHERPMTRYFPEVVEAVRRLVRTEVGRLPVHLLPRRRRGRARQPQRAADDALLPRARRGHQG